MKIKFAIMVLIVTIGLIPGAMGQKHYKNLKYPPVREVQVPKPKQITLDNGMKVLLLEDHELPFINMRGLFIAGSAWEPADKVGLADITGSVMRTGGSKSLPGDQMDEELESIAASVETWITTLQGGAAMSTIKDHFDKVLAIYADVLMNPAFPEDKIDLAKIEAKSYISRRNDQVTQIADREYNQLIYGADSPYYRDMEYASIDAIGRDDIVSFHKNNVHPNGMILGVWGDFKTDDMVKKLKKTFNRWKITGSATLKPPEVNYVFKKTVNLIEKPDVNQTNIYLGHIGGMKNNPDNPALIMMNEILSGGFSSRLFSRLRSNQGLAYHVSGVYGTNYIYPGTFYMLLQTNSERTVEAIRSMLKELTLMTEELVSDEELKVAKEGWLNSFVFNYDNTDKVMERLLTYAYYGYPLDYLEKIRMGIEKVSKEDILKVSRKYLKPDQVQILAVGKSADFDESLSVLGEKVNVIDISIPVIKEKTPEATDETLSKGKIIFGKMITSLGGKEAFRNIKSYHWKGSMTIVTPQGEMPMAGEMIMLLPDRSRAIIKLPMGEMSQVMNGDNAWLVSPQGKMQATGMMKDEIVAGYWRDLFVLAARSDDPTLAVQYIGQEDVDGKKSEVLMFTPQGVANFKVYLNAADFTPLKMSYQGMTMMGAPAATEELYSDHRNVANIRLPFKTVKFQDGKKSQETTATEILLNVDVDEKLFVVE